MNLLDLLNQVADDADAGTLADPVQIRRVGDRRRVRRRRVVGCAAAVAAVLAGGALLLAPSGDDRVEPAPPVLPDRVSYLKDGHISFVADDGSRHTVRAENADRFAFSADGRHLAYVTHHGNTSRLWLADGDGSNRDRQPAPCADCMPGFGLTWSNDGTRLAYAVLTPGTRRAQLRILTMATGAHQVFRMPRGCEARGPRFSPDDQSLAISLACEDGQYTATLDPDRATSAPTRLTPAFNQVQAPSWSADGETIYFTASTTGRDTNDVTGTGDVFAVSADGTGLRQLTHAVPGERFVGATPYQDQFLVNRARGRGPWVIGWLSSDGEKFTPMTGPDGKPVEGDLPQLQP